MKAPLQIVSPSKIIHAIPDGQRVSDYRAALDKGMIPDRAGRTLALALLTCA